MPILVPDAFWPLITRLGESEIVLPLAFGLALSMLMISTTRSVLVWMGLFAGAVLITTASKVAFIGWGLGIASLDFTGFSGHATLAAAVYPLLGAVVLQRRGRLWALAGASGGAVLAALIALSRVRVHAHSVSEVAAGLALGMVVSVCALIWLRASIRRHTTEVSPAAAPIPRVGANKRAPRRVSRWMWIGMAAWLVVMPLHARPSTTHGLVVKLALKLSGRVQPYQRGDWPHTSQAISRAQTLDPGRLHDALIASHSSLIRQGGPVSV